jgi:lipoprotein-anchoring transpeptidase ErfK/SrfK
MSRILLVGALCCFVGVGSAGAQMAQSSLQTETPLYYSVQRQATVFLQPDSTQPYLRLGLREPVFLLEEQGAWAYIRTQDGALGYVTAAAISNTWLRVSKSKRTVYFYRGHELVEALPADLSYNTFSDKQRRGSVREPDHWRTPEGVFYVVSKNPRSKFYKALVLNYPSAEDARSGLAEGVISKAEHDAIVRAEEALAMPPMHTALGGWIEIHGEGTGARSNWTQGCVALKNEDLDRLWGWVDVGTPVLVEP